MADFTVDWSSGNSEGIVGKEPIQIPQKTVDYSTSLPLTGRGVNNYGEIQQENFIRLLENFASNNPPTNPTVGQLWFKPADKSLYLAIQASTAGTSTVYYPSGAIAWLKVISTANGTDIATRVACQDTAPANPVRGDLWYESSSTLRGYVFDGDSWIDFSPSGTGPQGPQGPQGPAGPQGPQGPAGTGGGSDVPVGGGTDKVFYLNDTTVNSSYTIPSGKNAMSAGPVTIANGVTVTVPDGSVWNVVGGSAGSSSGGSGPHTHPWSQITGTPTTLAGYGITDGGSSGGATVSVGATPPSSPTTGTIWYENATVNRAFIWNGATWVDMNPALGSVTEGGGLGVGQTWQDMSASRAFNTTYTNTTGKPILVSIHCFATGYDSYNIELNVDGLTVSRNGIAALNYAIDSVNVTAIVPNNSIYSLARTGSNAVVNLNKWAELR